MLLIANPRAGGGRIGRQLPEITDQLRGVFPELEVATTSEAGGGRDLALRACNDGHRRVLSLGGDGTHSEVTAGLVDSGLPDLSLGILHGGTGGDFSRLLGRGTFVDQARRIADLPSKAIDLIEVSWTDTRGTPQRRAVLNEISAGLSGEICARVNRSSKRLGGGPTFLIHTLRALVSYSPQPMEIEIDGELIDAGPVTSALVCNGRFAGGGMHFSPQSRITDGWLEVVVIADAPTTTALRHLPKLYDGRIGDAPHIQTYRGREIALRSLGLPIAAEADGEVLGTTPVRATILPGAMHLMGVPDQLT